MTDLDLSKAVQAGALAIAGGDQRYVDGYAEGDASAALTAALPHILDALAKRAEVSGALTDDSIRWAYLRFTAEWLRIEAAEARSESLN